MWECRNRTEGLGQQTGLSPSGQTRPLSAWKRCPGQTRRPTDGQLRRPKARGVGRLGEERRAGSQALYRESDPSSGPGSPQSLWCKGLSHQSRATSHQLGFRIKLEVLDGLVVLDVVFQFHYLVLKLNMPPTLVHGHRSSS